MTLFNVQIISIILSTLLFLFVIELVRKGMLKERYAILWLASSFILLVRSLWKGLLDKIAAFFGIFYSPSLLFLAAFLFLLLIVLHFSIVISRMSEKNKKLAQEMGLLKYELENKKSVKDGDKNREEAG